MIVIKNGTFHITINFLKKVLENINLIGESTFVLH